MRIILLLCYCLLIYSGEVFAMAKAQDQRPNFVVIVVDDQRWDEFGAAGHSFLQTPNIDRLAAEGTRFTEAYAATPLCSPNRASLLTGQYISRHGVRDNIARDLSSHRLPLFPQALQKSGYTTAHVGKWHMGNDATPRPGYDYWLSYSGQGRSVNPILFENGKSAEVQGYMTDVLSDRAISFIENASQNKNKPFFLYIGHKAIHPEVKQRNDSSIDIHYGSKYRAADRHIGRYKGKKFKRRENVTSDISKLKGKPVLQAALKEKYSQASRDKWGKILDPNTSDQTIEDRSEMLLAIDEGLGRVIQALEDKGILDNTVIIFTSDNGYYYGEHGLSIERRMPYEEGIRVPLLIRYPQVFPSTASDKFAVSVDLSATVLSLAGLKPGAHIAGKNLADAVTGKPWRQSFMVEYSSYEKPMEWLVDTSYKVIRKGQYKYIYWLQQQDKNELYDLKADPYELNNLAQQGQYRHLIKELEGELARLSAEAIGLN